MIGIYMMMFMLGVTTVLSIVGLIAIRDWYRKAHPAKETKKETESKETAETTA